MCRARDRTLFVRINNGPFRCFDLFVNLFINLLQDNQEIDQKGDQLVILS